jgi:hypothetical protein
MDRVVPSPFSTDSVVASQAAAAAVDPARVERA